MKHYVIGILTASDNSSGESNTITKVVTALNEVQALKQAKLLITVDNPNLIDGDIWAWHIEQLNYDSISHIASQ